ncbi:MAG: pirin family protein [Ferruginibacter sp.]|nr:pirin family protein [Ferruginibacter sp.]
MKTILHRATTRGHANHGWLNTYHTFSFANYHNPDRIHFGALKVLNDDTVSPGAGFGTHPHENMEIISIPLAGQLQHGDNMGNSGIIKKGEVQIMTAGTGVTHSEKNGSNKEDVKFLQIWIFPKELNLKPRYDQLTIENNTKQNDFQKIISPNANDEGLQINQDAWLHLAHFKKGTLNNYQIKMEGNGVYVFVIEGNVKINDLILNKRDGLGVSETDDLAIEALEDADFLLIEVPMKLPDYFV